MGGGLFGVFFGPPGAPELLIVGLIVLGVLSYLARTRGVSVPGPALVLKEFTVSPRPIDSYYIRISGRPQGVLAWLLSLSGIGTDTSFYVSAGDVNFSSASLSGKFRSFVPLRNVASAHSGYSQNIALIFVAGILALGGLIVAASVKEGGATVFLVGLVLAALCLLAFWLSRKMILAIETNGGMILGVKFKRSLIENVPVDFQETAEAIRVLNLLIAQSHGRTRHADPSRGGPSNSPSPGSQHRPTPPPIP